MLPNVRTYALLYEDVNAMMQDFELLVEEQRFQHIDGWCMPVRRNIWQALSGQLYAHRIFSVFLSVEWDGNPPNQDELLGDLHYSRLTGHIDDSTFRVRNSHGERLPPLWFASQSDQSKPRLGQRRRKSGAITGSTTGISHTLAQRGFCPGILFQAS